MGAQFWDQYGFWNSAALLIGSGHSDTLVRLYDEARPLIASKRLSIERVTQPETIIALRKAGRQADADRLLAQYRQDKDRLPDRGLLGEEKQFSIGVIAALTGNRDAAIRTLDEVSRRNPFRMVPIPAMALRYDPVFGRLANDPRFPAIEERLRLGVNAERQKAGLAPIARDAWISDPHSLLTKN
jgi:hypothetical protein